MPRAPLALVTVEEVKQAMGEIWGHIAADFLDASTIETEVIVDRMTRGLTVRFSGMRLIPDDYDGPRFSEPDPEGDDE